MNIKQLHELFETHKNCFELEWQGDCHGCGKETSVLVELTSNGFKVSGGALYEKDGNYKIKCENCFNEHPEIYQECEVYSRVVGYLRPVNQWNKGKRAEWNDRKAFKMEGA